MREGTRTALLEDGQVEEGIVKRAIAAALGATPDSRVKAGLEVAIEDAETDPVSARSTLLELRADHRTLAKLESWLGGDPQRATFGLGAAIKIADAELAKESPDLRALTPELLHWLEGNW